jgi:hypothetical protein
MGSIYEFVKEQRDRYRSDTIQIADGYEFSQYETLRTIELYHNSKFLTTNKDSLGREKPFYNISKFRVNVATRATDINTKDVKIESERADKDAYTTSFLLDLRNRNWMKQSNFPTFLNRMGFTRSKFGGVLIKKIEKGNELSVHVMQWRNMITDQVDIRNGVKIERHYYTPAELKESGWNKIDGAISTAKKSQEAIAANSPSTKNRTPGNYIEVFEVHGVLPDCYRTPSESDTPTTEGASTNESPETYSRQMHVIVLDESSKDEAKGVSLYDGPEDEDPYKYLPYEEVDGRGLGVGVIEDLFEAQVWTNYGVKQKKDMLDLAGKIIFQTSDGSIAAKNILTDLENGQIITTALNQPITQVNNVPAGYAGLSNLMDDWNTQAENVTSTYPAILGSTPPHGTAFRTVAAMNQEASALFEYRRQEAGIFIQEIYADWVLPFLVNQITNQKELIANLEPDELEMLSNAVAEHEALTFAKSQLLPKAQDGGTAPLGKLVHNQDLAAIKHAAKTKTTKRTRHGFHEFADLFTGWKGTVDVNVTGEQKDKDKMLGYLFQLFGAIAANPAMLQDKTMARIFNEIVETIGASPLFQQSDPGQSGAQPQEPQPQQPQPQPTPQPQPAIAAPANAAV